MTHASIAGTVLHGTPNGRMFEATVSSCEKRSSKLLSPQSRVLPGRVKDGADGKKLSTRNFARRQSAK